MKVVINRCYGGFGLSAKAYKELAKLEGRECYFFTQNYPSNDYTSVSLNGADEASMFYAFDVSNPNDLKTEEQNKHFIYYDSSARRDDPNLIKVVEKLGDKANGKHAKLEIIEIPDGIEWEIDEYDGVERVEEVHRSWY